MAQYQSIDPPLVALQSAKKVPPQVKKPVPMMSTTGTPLNPSLNAPMQQPQAPTANITPPTPSFGGISSPFGATNINQTPNIGASTPNQIGTTATQLQSLPKQIPATGTSKLSMDDFANKIKEKYPEYADRDNKTLAEAMLKKYPEYNDKVELQGGQSKSFIGQGVDRAKDFVSNSSNPLINNPLTRGYTNIVGGLANVADQTLVQPFATAVRGGAGLANKAYEAVGIDTPMESTTTVGQDVLNIAEGGLGTAFNVVAPVSSLIFGIASKTPGLDKAVEGFGWTMGKVGEQINRLPALKQYRENLPPEDQARLDGLVGNSLLAFLGSKSKGKISEGDIRGYLDDNFGTVGALDKAFLERVPKSLPKVGEGAGNYLAEKLINNKLKITKPNKDAVRKSSGLEASEFILENDIGAGSVDDMITKTEKLVDDSMATKFKTLESVKELQPITQREKLIGQSIVSQAKNDISEVYGKPFDDITPDEIIPELKEQFAIVNNVQDLIKSTETTAIKMEALKSLYDVYNSHLKYDLTKKRILSSAEQIRLGLQKDIEKVGQSVGVDINGLNKKIAGGKALIKGLIQAGDRLDNNNMFGLSDTQTAILGAALGGGPIGITLGLAGKSVLENMGVRAGLAKKLYTKKPIDAKQGSTSNNKPMVNTATARANISNQFGSSDTIVNSDSVNPTLNSKPTPTVRETGVIGQPYKVPKPPKTKPVMPKAIDSKPQVEGKYIPGKTDISNYTYDQYKKIVQQEFPGIHTDNDIQRMYKTLQDEGTIKNKPVAPKKGLPKLGKEIMEQNITKGDDLISEAKKYKSADEFVNKQDIVYHGTNNEFDNFQLSTNKTKRASSVNSKAVFFADDKNSVKYYGKNIKGAMIDKSNLFDYKNPDHIKELERYLEKYSVQDVQPGALFGKDSLMSFLKKGDYGLIESKLIQSYIKKKGFDGFIANDYGSKDVYGILNLDKIKTESQLRQIREQANKPSLGKPKVPGK